MKRIRQRVKERTLETYARSLGPVPGPFAGGRSGVRATQLVHTIAAWRAMACVPR